MTTNEMTPELLALLTPEQQEAWERCQKATPGPLTYDRRSSLTNWRDDCTFEMEWMPNTPYENEDADGYFFAHARQDLPDALLELAQAKAAVAELRAAVADAPHDMWCAVTFPAAPADLITCNCRKAETK